MKRYVIVRVTDDGEVALVREAQDVVYVSYSQNEAISLAMALNGAVADASFFTEEVGTAN